MQPGDVLADRYEVEDLVGRGGMGRVYRATDRVLGRRVALKVLSHELADDDESVTRILTEARLAAKVRHPNVVQVLDALVSEDHSPVIVLEYVEGPSLAEHIREHAPLSVDETLDIVAEVAAGLTAAHNAELVHRDVSPANILIDDGTARLTDFGIARSTTASKTLTGTIRGSVAYVAPEQATGTEVGPASDVYALACVAVTMLTGRPPFDADEPLGVVHQHVSAPPPDVRTSRPEVPMEVAVAIQAAMAKDPARRIPNAAALAAAIGRPLRHDDTEVVFLPSTASHEIPLPHNPGPTGGEGSQETAAIGPMATGAAGGGPPAPILRPEIEAIGAPAAAASVANASSVVSANSVASADVDASGSGSGPIVVIGTTTDPGIVTAGPDADSGDGRRVPLRWLGTAAVVATILGVVIGQYVSAPDDTVQASEGDASSTESPAGDRLDVASSPSDLLEDALLALRGQLADLQAADAVELDRGGLIDERIDMVVEAVADGDLSAVQPRLDAVRSAIHSGVQADEVTPEAEVTLLESIILVEDELDAVDDAEV